MIGFFPEIYPDELLYSQLSRYYQRTGYTKYIFAVDDLFMRRTARPVIEWVNEYTPDAMEHITRNMNFEQVIRNHTMFPAYTRFLPKERRNKALQSLISCDGNYYNLVVNQNVGYRRYLRYCPLCSKDDREQYGETFWHREHQIIRIDICPKHQCFLKDSKIPIGSKTTPGLHCAETEVPHDDTVETCDAEHLIAFSKYVLDVFREPVDIEGDTPIGAYLQSCLEAKYLSDTGVYLNSTLLYGDYKDFIKDICEPISFEMFRKTYYNTRCDHHKICQLAFFEKIPPEKLAALPQTVTSTAMEMFYRELSDQYTLPYETILEIGEAILAKQRNLGKLARKSGPKQRAWAELDEKYLPQVKQLVDQIYNADGKPQKVSIAGIERAMGAPSKQFQKLPKCMKYVLAHIETQNEYRARRVIWAVRLFKQESRPLSHNKINKFLSLRKNDLLACYPYIQDLEVKKVVANLLRETSDINSEVPSPGKEQK